MSGLSTQSPPKLEPLSGEFYEFDQTATRCCDLGFRDLVSLERRLSLGSPKLRRLQQEIEPLIDARVAILGLSGAHAPTYRIVWRALILGLTRFSSFLWMRRYQADLAKRDSASDGEAK